MAKGLFFGVIFFIVVIAYSVSADVSYSEYGDMIRLSNDYESYCINKTSGLQFGTDISLDCSAPLFTKNEICAEGSRPSGHFRYCFESIPYDNLNIIDNGEYINITFDTQIGTPNNNVKLILNYHLKNSTDMKLYQDFTIENNLQNNVKLPSNFSYVMKDITFNNSLIVLGNDEYNLDNLTYNERNGLYDGITVIDESKKYFHLNFPNYPNTYDLYIKDKIINLTLDGFEIDNWDSKTYTFSYFDPAGTCTFLGNSGYSCYGNGYDINGADSYQIDGAGREALIYVFNYTLEKAFVESIALCYGARTGNPDFILNITIEGVTSSKNPNGTIYAYTHHFPPPTQCIKVNFVSRLTGQEIPLSYGTEYAVHINGQNSIDPIQAGESIVVNYNNPRVKEDQINFDMEGNDESQVRVCCLGGTKIDSDGTPKYMLGMNLTNYPFDLRYFGTTIINEQNKILSGTQTLHQFFYPYKDNIEIYGIRLQIGNFFGANNGNIFFEINDKTDGETDCKGSIPASWLNGVSTPIWLDKMFNDTEENNISLQHNHLYELKLYTNCSCFYYSLTTLLESTFNVISLGNSSWQDNNTGLLETSNNNGTSLGFTYGEDLQWQFYRVDLPITQPPIEEKELISTFMTLSIITFAVILIIIATTILAPLKT